MNSIILLLVAGLVSIHQYLPADDPGYHKQFNDVRELKEEQVFPAAHQSCRYIYSVLIDAGLEQTLGGANEGVLGDVFSSILGSKKGLDSILSMIDSPFVEEKLGGEKVSGKELKQFLTKLCSEDFNPLTFLPQERKAVFDFINQEIKVLGDEDLQSLGQFKSFGLTKIFDRNDKVIGQLEPSSKRWTPYRELAPTLPLSLIATEDRGFFGHQGVEIKSVARIAGEASTSSRVTGGSTVTMQLLKNMFFADSYISSIKELTTGSSQTLLRKVREWYWALPFEQNFSRFDSDIAGKEKIIELYFNLVTFGPGIQGIAQATQVYFDKKPSEVTIDEAAFIASLLKAPSFYSREQNYAEQTLPRRNMILTSVSEICEKVFIERSTTADDVVYKMCRDPEGTIYGYSLLPELKLKELPQWEREQKFTTDPALHSVLNYVKSWLPSFLEDKKGRIQELSLKTTIDSDLQEILYQTVRKKIDAYDNERQSLSYVEPARDDRGRQARIRKEDLGYIFEYQLNRLAQRASNSERTVLISTYLGVQGEGNRLSLSRSDLVDVFKKMRPNSIDTVKEANALIKQLQKGSSRLGDTAYVVVRPEGTEVISFDEFLDLLNIDVAEREEIRKDLSRPAIASRLQKNSLARLDRYRHRDFLKPILLLGNGRLVDKDNNDIQLFKSHLSYVRRKFNRAGTFFWVRTEDDSIAKPLYSLDAPRLQASAIVMDTETGAVLANFAGYDPRKSSFDRSLWGQRQLGSTVKPWIYYLALNKGFNPGDILENGFVSFAMNNGRSYYTPRNYSGSFPARMTLERSLVNSQNIATVGLIQDSRWSPGSGWAANLQDVRAMFEQAGLYDESFNRPSILLGTQESTLQKITQSYSYFSNGESIAESFFIDQVVDYQGKSLFSQQPQRTRVPQPRFGTLEQMQRMMVEIANSGTAARLNGFTRQMETSGKLSGCFNGAISQSHQSCFAGKTGTTDDGRDTWFIGFSKKFAIGVWVGYDEFRPIPGKSTGGALALPIFMDIVENGQSHLPEILPVVGERAFPSLIGANTTGNSPLSPDLFTSPLDGLGEGAETNSTFVENRPVPPVETKPIVTSRVQSRSLRCRCEPAGGPFFSISVTMASGQVVRSSKNHLNRDRCQRAISTVTIEGVRVCRI